MKRLTVFLIVIIAVLSFSLSFSAPGNAGEHNLSLKRAASRTFTAKQLRGLQVVNQEGMTIGNIQDVTFDSRTGRIKSITFNGLSQKNYGLAPAWGRPNNFSSEGKRQDESLKFKRLPEQNYGLAPAWGRPNNFSSEGKKQDESLKFKPLPEQNYGLSPAWGKPDGYLWRDRIEQDPSWNPSSQYLYNR